MALKTKDIKILFIISLLMLSPTAFCCDMSAFVQSEFADRCQRLINHVDKAYISVAVEHPDSDKKLSEVSKDWIDFYLSHGNRTVQPPNMNFISSDIWERNIKDLGLKFGKFLHKKLDAKTYISGNIAASCLWRAIMPSSPLWVPVAVCSTTTA